MNISRDFTLFYLKIIHKVYPQIFRSLFSPKTQLTYQIIPKKMKGEGPGSGKANSAL